MLDVDWVVVEVVDGLLCLVNMYSGIIAGDEKREAVVSLRSI
jgi:hypothetical protein